MKNGKLLFIFCGLVFSIYIIYGLFFPHIPHIRPDDFWEISRAHFLLKYHRLGDPMFPDEISPMMASLYNITIASRFLGLIKTGSQAFFIGLLPIEDVYAFRLTSFAWSLLVCFLTYKLALKAGLNKNTSLLSAALLIITPEFFSQLHTQRPEMMITAAFLAGLLVFNSILKTEDGWKKITCLFFSGIYGWFAAFTIHPNAIVIPVTLGFVYLVSEYKKIFSLNTFIFGLTLLGGAYYFNYLMNAPVHQSMMEGGGDFLRVQGPPVLRLGLKIILLFPVIFYNKFAGYNEFAKPVSLFFFLFSCISFYFLFKRRKIFFANHNLKILGLGIIAPLIILILLSGSNGHYHIIYFPLCSILIASAIHEFVFKESKIKLTLFLGGSLCIFFLSGFRGLSREMKYTREYERITDEAKKTITDNKAIVIGNGIFYGCFSDRIFYSNSGLSPSIGKRDQSYEESVRKVNANYVIIDEYFVQKMNKTRKKEWMDDMFAFLDKNCQLIKEIKSDYYFKQKKPGKAHPKQQMELQGKIKIYKVIT
ncbi:MAG TPA: hypothetical protein VJY62_12385 [Bacteroidia bacterium]|nr:hypothetical protein [Bacteroidia bacterium]